MTDIYIPSDKTKVIIPKTGFKTDSRNPLANIFRSAGYDKVADGDFNDSDRIVEQGDFEFIGIKGSSALAYQMNRPLANEGLPIVMGSDILLDAEMLLLERGIQVQLQKILDMNVGPCSLQFLSPNEDPLQSREDLIGRRIFTKYAALLRKVLQEWNTGASDIWELNGADTRVAEARDDGDTNTAAFEIVGSGKTARGNRLTISEFFPNTVDVENISTDLYLQNPNNLTTASRQKIIEFGLSLEGALGRNIKTIIKFNVPGNMLSEFQQYGTKGPTVSPILSINKVDKWYALEIAVQTADANRIVSELLKKGAEDAIIEREMPMGISSKNSQIMQALSS